MSPTELIATVLALWLLPAVVFALHLIRERIYDRGYRDGYNHCAEDCERDAIDQLHRDLERFVREGA